MGQFPMEAESEREGMRGVEVQQSASLALEMEEGAIR